MEHQTFQNPFLNIPKRKLDDALEDIAKVHSNNGILTMDGAILTEVFYHYYSSNIPVDYWFRDMHDFVGPEIFKRYYNEVTKDVKQSFKIGKSGCLAAKHGTGKMIDLDTDLPTPNGFVKLKNLKVNDQLFDENGNICNVVELHPIDNNPESYKLTFDDGSVINACADHLWIIYNHTQDNTTSTIKNTKEIFNTLKVNIKQKTSNHSIPCSKPLKFKHKELLIHPYTFGYWLGSSIHSNESVIEDIFEFNNLGLLSSYLNSSYEQRLNLLQGLMDSHGSIDELGICEISSSIKELFSYICNLILSLGIKININQNKIIFTTNLPIFQVSEKLQKINKIQDIKTTHRYIISVERINPIPMRCITVDSPSHLFLVTKNYIPTHNTMSVSCILKRVIETNKYSALYVNLTDIIHVMLTSDFATKSAAREMLLKVDFLVIDELDPRFMGSENAADLFGRILEPIMRTRIQNKMPLYFCTNSAKVESSFSGPLQASIESLMNLVKLVPVIGGKDARDSIRKGELS